MTAQLKIITMAHGTLAGIVVFSKSANKTICFIFSNIVIQHMFYFMSYTYQHCHVSTVISALHCHVSTLMLTMSC